MKNIRRDSNIDELESKAGISVDRIIARDIDRKVKRRIKDYQHIKN